MIRPCFPLRSALATLFLGVLGCTSDKPSLTAPDLALLAECSNSVTLVRRDSPVRAHTGGHEGTFRITNQRTTTYSGAVTCRASGSVTCIEVTPSAVTLDGGESTVVTAEFRAGAPGLDT